MAKQSLDESIDEANKAYGGPSDYYKLKNGDNLVRILTPFKVYGKHFSKSGYKGVCIGREEGCKGCEEGTKPNAKWLAWGYVPAKWNDEIVNELRLLDFGYKILTQLRDWQKDDERGFAEFPMPYAINIKTQNAGQTDVIYTVMPRKDSPVDEAMMIAMEKKQTPEQIVEAMKEKKGKGDKQVALTGKNYEYPQDSIDPDDIPF